MAKNNIYINEVIDILDLDKNIEKILKDNQINKIEDLWILNRKKLKEFGLKDADIKQIVIKLQLLGLDLNKRVYN
ncbi:MAG: hypothetical protein J1F35_03980 [Erysipelotrichales bacterium]|nr:hypothetical protein [Erysipelotrichales bacterium]